MKNNETKHETEYIKEYQELGFTDNFRIADGKLISGETGTSYQETELKIMGENRFEGISNPSDLSILYAIEAKDGTKGTLVTAYGPDADVSEYEFLKKVPEAKADERVDEPMQ
ncbi:hypothetical protein LCGC14_2772050 [marine sediment metagenome]|uniref:Phosphoribosylpyrophosphate synthetase n=2 Tax=root TaxID=1 RepID=A0A831QRA7_9FLAO|nr:hypothetical protein [Pricia antarctica]